MTPFHESDRKSQWTNNFLALLSCYLYTHFRLTLNLGIHVQHGVRIAQCVYDYTFQFNEVEN